MPRHHYCSASYQCGCWCYGSAKRFYHQYPWQIRSEHPVLPCHFEVDDCLGESGSLQLVEHIPARDTIDKRSALRPQGISMILGLTEQLCFVAASVVGSFYDCVSLPEGQRTGCHQPPTMPQDPGDLAESPIEIVHMFK